MASNVELFNLVVPFLHAQGQPFNKYLKGLDPGGFKLCATVQGITGCLNGEVLAK